MQAILCLTAVCAFAALAQAEQCRDVGGCSHVTCPEAGYSLDCHNHECTCTQHGTTCAAAADCTGSCSHTLHCVDGRCRCFGFGAGK